MHASRLLACFVLSMLGACATVADPPPLAAAKAQVVGAEEAFAKSMADRDHAAFAQFLSADAVFINGPTPLVGKAAVAAAWKRFFDGKEAPFSWRPQTVEVLASGDLAFSSGPVFDPVGKQVGTFTSIWRREGPDVWRVVFDTGNDVCDCPKKP